MGQLRKTLGFRLIKQSKWAWALVNVRRVVKRKKFSNFGWGMCSTFHHISVSSKDYIKKQ